MIRSLLLSCLFLSSIAHAQEDWGAEIQNQTVKVSGIKNELRKNNLPAKQTEDLRKQEAAVLANIQKIGDTRPKNPAAQLAVGRSLASVEEAPRAVPYAERGLALAEASGDQKLLREALLTGGQIYEKTGQYDLARERAQRVLKINPKDKEALALYMMVKDRVSISESMRLGAVPMGGSGNGVGARSGNEAASRTSAGSSVPMTNAASLTAQKYLADGLRKMALDPKAALNSFDQAVAADPKSAAVHVQRSKARLATGDAAGALEDAETAAALDPKSAAAYAARAAAKNALGRKAEEMAADYEMAAKLDGRYAETYKTLLSKMAGSSADEAKTAASGANGRSAPDGPRGMLPATPKGWGVFALICAIAAGLGFILAPLRLRKRP